MLLQNVIDGIVEIGPVFLSPWFMASGKMTRNPSCANFLACVKDNSLADCQP